MSEDRARGELDQAKSVVKENVGKITSDRSTEVSGKLDQVKGKLEKTIGKAKGTIRDKVGRHR